LQLIHPLGDNSPIASFLEKNKMGGIHHVSIEVRYSRHCVFGLSRIPVSSFEIPCQ
jgi:methylmalonyl-CoA/ethylmalonyl-CoA epimerase